MNSEVQRTKLVPVDLGNGVVVQVEVTKTGLENVSSKLLPFGAVADAITRISEVVAESIQAVRPTKAVVKYGLSIGIEQGSLVAAIVRGTGKANLEITLEWENKLEQEKKVDSEATKIQSN